MPSCVVSDNDNSPRRDYPANLCLLGCGAAIEIKVDFPAPIRVVPFHSRRYTNRLCFRSDTNVCGNTSYAIIELNVQTGCHGNNRLRGMVPWPRSSPLNEAGYISGTVLQRSTGWSMQPRALGGLRAPVVVVKLRLSSERQTRGDPLATSARKRTTENTFPRTTTVAVFSTWKTRHSRLWLRGCVNHVKDLQYSIQVLNLNHAVYLQNTRRSSQLMIAVRCSPSVTSRLGETLNERRSLRTPLRLSLVVLIKSVATKAYTPLSATRSRRTTKNEAETTGDTSNTCKQPV